MKITIFDDIFDEREAWKVIHEFQNILVLSLCAILCGVEDYEAIEEYGNQKEDFRYLDLSSLAEYLKRNAQQVVRSVIEFCRYNFIVKGGTNSGMMEVGKGFCEEYVRV